MNRIYLDWNATAPLLPEVKEAMIDALENLAGNASSIHREGQAARSVVERARRKVAAAINSPPQAVFFTAGATESNNQVLRDHARKNPDAKIVCVSTEHPSVLEVVEELQRDGVDASVWGVRADGTVKVGEGEPTLVSVMYANNETGVIQPIKEVRDQFPDAQLHVDATQAFGRIPIDFEGLGVDFMTLSFHKMGGPKGIGAVVIREGLKIDAILAGGHQERGRRPGTENVPAAAGLIVAADLVLARLPDWRTKLEELGEAFLDALAESPIPYEIRGAEPRLSNTFNIAFSGIDGEDLLLALDLAGVSASSGSACTAGSLEPSHVVLAMGYDEKSARESVRFSFGPTTTTEEVVEAARRVIEAVDHLSSI